MNDPDLIIFVHYMELALAAYDNDYKYNWKGIEPYLRNKEPYEIEAIKAFVQSLDNNERYTK